MNLLTVTEVAKMLRVSRQWVVKQIQDGNINAHRVGKLYRIEETEINRILNK